IRNGSSHEPSLRLSLAWLLTYSLTAVPNSERASQAEVLLRRLLDVIAPLSSDERAASWFHYLHTALRANLDDESFEAMLREIAARFPDRAQILEVFRVAQRMRSTGDQIVPDGVDDDLARAARDLLND